MKTELLSPTPEALSRAGELLRGGEVVGFPTETVYGLGANALDASAVEKIFAAKGGRATIRSSSTSRRRRSLRRSSPGSPERRRAP